MTENASQGSINQQIFPLIPERFLSELPEPPLPLAMAACKQVMREVDDWPQNEQFARQREITSSVFDSHDAKEGARAFVEKRKPIWRGC